MNDGTEIIDCEKFPKTRLMARACGIRYRQARSPQAFPYGVMPESPKSVDYINPSMFYCRDCETGRVNSELYPDAKPLPPSMFTRVERRTGVCKICGEPLKARGLCKPHYDRWYKGVAEMVELLGPWFPGPMEPKIRKEETVEKHVEVVCRRCEKRASGTVEEVSTLFQPNKLAVSGFDGVCRECKTNKMTATWRAGKERREKGADPYRVELDFNEDVDLFLAVQELARQGRRDVSNQIMWILDQKAGGE